MRNILYLEVISPDIRLPAHYLINYEEVNQLSMEDEVITCCSFSGTYTHPKARNDNTIGIKLSNTHNSTLYTASVLISNLLLRYNLDKLQVLKPSDITSRKGQFDYISTLWDSLISQI